MHFRAFLWAACACVVASAGHAQAPATCDTVGGSLDTSDLISLYSGQTVETHLPGDTTVYTESHGEVAGPDIVSVVFDRGAGFTYRIDPAGTYCHRFPGTTTWDCASLSACTSGTAAAIATYEGATEPGFLVVPKRPNSAEDVAQIGNLLSDLGSTDPDDPYAALDLVGNQEARTVLTVDGCTVVSKFGADDFDWTGTCTNGVISGAGTLTLYIDERIVERMELDSVGEPYELTDGAIHWSDQPLNALPGNPTYYRWFDFYSMIFLDDQVLHLDTEQAVMRMAHRSYDAFVTQHGGFGGTPSHLTGLIVSFMTSDEYMNYLRGTSDLFSGRAFVVLDGLGRRIPATLNEGTPELLANRAEIAAFNDTVNLRKAEEAVTAWAEAKKAEIAGTETIPNVADILQADKGGAIATLAAGRTIRFEVEEIGFSGGTATISDWQPYTDPTEGIPKPAQSTTSAIMDAAANAGRSGGDRIICEVPTESLAALPQGETVEVSAQLQGLQESGSWFVARFVCQP